MKRKKPRRRRTPRPHDPSQIKVHLHIPGKGHAAKVSGHAKPSGHAKGGPSLPERLSGRQLRFHQGQALRAFWDRVHARRDMAYSVRQDLQRLEQLREKMQRSRAEFEVLRLRAELEALRQRELEALRQRELEVLRQPRGRR